MEQKKRPLTEKDIKTIRTEKRMGYVFASLVFTIGAFVSLVVNHSPIYVNFGYEKN